MGRPAPRTAEPSSRAPTPQSPALVATQEASLSARPDHGASASSAELQTALLAQRGAAENIELPAMPAFPDFSGTDYTPPSEDDGFLASSHHRFASMPPGFRFNSHTPLATRVGSLPLPLIRPRQRTPSLLPFS